MERRLMEMAHPPDEAVYAHRVGEVTCSVGVTTRVPAVADSHDFINLFVPGNDFLRDIHLVSLNLRMARHQKYIVSVAPVGTRGDNFDCCRFSEHGVGWGMADVRWKYIRNRAR